MFILRVQHPVPDYDAWKTLFDSDPVGRERSGVRRYRVLRPIDEAHQVQVDLEFDTRAAAEATHAALRQMWNRVQGSVIGAPSAQIVEVVERRQYGQPSAY